MALSFSMVHTSNSLGTVNPVANLCARARKLGIVTLVDGAQSAGHMPVDVQAIGCDFFTFSGHKICGPTGIGVLWGREELLNAMPPYHGGGEMILNVDFFKTTYKPAPHRFEAGTPDIAGAIGLIWAGRDDRYSELRSALQAEAGSGRKLKYCFSASTSCPYSGGARCRLNPAS